MKMKNVWVKAPFKELGYWKKERVQVSTRIEKVEKGLFNKKLVDEKIPVYEEKNTWVKTGISDSEIDGEEFSVKINQEIELLAESGYEVISITPITSGRYKYDSDSEHFRDSGAGWGWGYGFSYTEGVNILAKMCT